MLDTDSNEYRTVMDLYENGRITAEERDKLLDALDTDSDGEKAEQDKTYSVGADDDVFSDDDNPKDDNRTVNGFVDDMKKMGDKISSAVDKSVKESLEAVSGILSDVGIDLSNINEAAVESSVKKSLEAVKDKLSDIGIDLKTDSTVIKKQRKDYAEDFDAMYIEVKYVTSDGNVYVFGEKTRDVEKLKSECRNVLSADGYDALCGLADEKFSGSYKTVKDGNVLKIKIAPSEQSDGAITLVNDSACDGSSKKIRLEKYDVPYDELIITARYVDDGSACVYSEKTSDSEKLKAECKPYLSERCFEALCTAIDDKIVGKLEYALGDEYLNVTVRPEKAKP